MCGCDSVCGLVLALGFCYWLCPFLCALKEGDYGACDQLLFMLLLANNVVYVKADVFSFCFDRWSVPFLYEKRRTKYTRSIETPDLANKVMGLCFVTSYVSSLQ